MKNTCMEIIYMLCGLMSLYVGVKTLSDKKHESRIGTAMFWIILGVLLGLGKWIPHMVAGILVVLMAVPAMFKKVKMGHNEVTPQEHRQKMSDKIGGKIFIPAFSMGICALIFAVCFKKLGALVGLGLGTIVSSAIVLIMSNDKPQTVPKEGKRLLEAVGPLSILPQLLASLGAIFTAAGVGDVISNGVSKIVPTGNITVAIIIYAVAMALFTMIMGNAFAAFSVITIGIGVPFILKYGLDPSVIGIIGLTSGYCGTLMTPMAANFNVVPVAILEMDDKYGVIKKQIPVALIMLVVQIIVMRLLA